MRSTPSCARGRVGAPDRLHDGELPEPLAVHAPDEAPAEVTAVPLGLFAVLEHEREVVADRLPPALDRDPSVASSTKNNRSRAEHRLTLAADTRSAHLTETHPGPAAGSDAGERRDLSSDFFDARRVARGGVSADAEEQSTVGMPFAHRLSPVRNADCRTGSGFGCRCRRRSRWRLGRRARLGSLRLDLGRRRIGS